MKVVSRFCTSSFELTCVEWKRVQGGKKERFRSLGTQYGCHVLIAYTMPTTICKRINGCFPFIWFILCFRIGKLQPHHGTILLYVLFRNLWFPLIHSNKSFLRSRNLGFVSGELTNRLCASDATVVSLWRRANVRTVTFVIWSESDDEGLRLESSAL